VVFTSICGEAITANGHGANLVQLSDMTPSDLTALKDRPLRIGLIVPSSNTGEAGYPPVKAVGMGIRENLDIGRVPPAEVIRFVESQLKGCSPDCVFLSCTNWRSVEAIEPLQRKLGIPIVTSNQAAADAVRRVGAGGRSPVTQRTTDAAAEFLKVGKTPRRPVR
jgi:maleate cis-trans isomerase